MPLIQWLRPSRFFYHAGLFGILINLVLMLLNLIPVPPLDGSRIVSAILPPKAAYAYSKIEPYGIWILLGLLIFGLLGRLLLPMVLYLMNFVRSIFGLPGNFLFKKKLCSWSRKPRRHFYLAFSLDSYNFSRESPLFFVSR